MGRGVEYVMLKADMVSSLSKNVSFESVIIEE